jgi:periplasmic protein TonB
MIEEQKRKFKATGFSLLLHLLVFAAIATTGLFAQVSADEKKPVDVAVYDMDAGDAGGGHSNSTAAAAAPSAGDIVFEKRVQVPQITEAYTETPEKQQEYKKNHQDKAENPAVNASTGAGSAALSAGSGQSSGSDGSVPGAGMGTGNGQVSGQGNGDGRDAAAAQRPKTPPQLISAPAPTYPESLRQQNAEGTVRVRMLVGTDGGVESAEVVESSGYGEMDAAALNAAYGYHFSPALNVYGEAVPCHTTRRIHFDLR